MTTIRQPTAYQVSDFWSLYRRTTSTVPSDEQPDGQTDDRPDDVFAFGDSAEMADELLELVLARTKRATAGAVVEYDARGWRPRIGDLSVVHRGDGTPGAVVRTTEVTIGSLTSVTDAFAFDEGEGDRTRAGWIRGHRAYLARSCARNGLAYDDDMEVVFERFQVLWPPACAAAD